MKIFCNLVFYGALLGSLVYSIYSNQQFIAIYLIISTILALCFELKGLGKKDKSE